MSFILLCLAVVFLCVPLPPPVLRWLPLALALLALIFWCLGANRGHFVLLA